MSFIKNKKGNLIAILVLTIMTLALSVFALFIFNNRANKLGGQLDYADIELLYVKEELINLYVNNILDDSFEQGVSKEVFTSNFIKNLEMYKEDGAFELEELSQIGPQLNKVIVEDNKVSLPLELKIAGFADKGIYASYEYAKVFEKEIPRSEDVVE